MERIKVKCSASEDEKVFSISLEDMGHTEETWAELTDEEQEEAARNYVNDELDNQPFWMLDKIIDED